MIPKEAKDQGHDQIQRPKTHDAPRQQEVAAVADVRVGVLQHALLRLQAVLDEHGAADGNGLWWFVVVV